MREQKYYVFAKWYVEAEREFGVSHSTSKIKKILDEFADKGIVSFGRMKDKSSWPPYLRIEPVPDVMGWMVLKPLKKLDMGFDFDNLKKTRNAKEVHYQNGNVYFKYRDVHFTFLMNYNTQKA